ncbi:VOC family protein [Altererythrobacter arenosus]|uniref:VOC family protein n=1 Tax=Altererythrobacter arenosus TaxID=3032592 RepID=A0ABY8FWZ8_9SPHN|nr:VOC family protein [Altererythrobacter sp. CAU 1644]WFL77766.1 VOC family protein [Altererythrobacter sp. CAU 1644]
MRPPSSTPERQHFVQVAYHVADIDEAMPRFARMMGIGPFLVRRHIGLEPVSYRGEPSALDISAAHAQAGPLQIELVMQHCSNRSAFRDMYAASEEGLHHLALFPENYDAMIAHYRAQGHEVATELVTPEKRGAAHIDTTAALGHMVEVYRVNETLYDFYRAVADAARDWEGETIAIEV